MKILFFGLDKNILVAGSAVQKRFISYGNLVEKIDILVPGVKKGETYISENVRVISFSSRSKIVSLLKFFFMGFALMKRVGYSLISTRDTYFVGSVAVFLSIITKTPLEIQVHGFEKYTGIRKLLAGFVLKKATGLRTVSFRLKNFLVSSFKLEGSKISVVPIFTDCTKFQYKERDVNRTSFTFITLSRLVKVKNIEMQLRAFHRLKKVFQNCQLLIGGSGPEEASLKEKTAELQISDSVHFLGNIDDTLSFFEKGDCFLLTSYSEGYGLAPIEAALSGLPVIMTNVGAANELLIHNENAVVIKIGDEKELLAEMIRIIEDNEFRKKICEANKDLSKKLLSEEETLQAYKDNWIKIAHEKFI